MSDILCGCRYISENDSSHDYLPQVSLKAHATLLSSISRTVLTQTFTNPSPRAVKEVAYMFPLFDGVSVVKYTCRVGNRVLHSEVKSRQQANYDYESAVSTGEKASVMDYSLCASDVLTVRLGIVGPGEQVVIDITFIGELKQDAQADGVRYTLPNSIAPRYGHQAESRRWWGGPKTKPVEEQGISIVVDVLMEKPSVIRDVQSPSHPVRMSLGRMSSEDTSVFEPSRASASLQLVKEDVLLERDFVIIVNADGQDTPHALLEEHSNIPGQRALLTTLVPKFNLPSIRPEIIFVIDRSGSMGDKISTLQSSLRVFLKSLPVGVYFNICSFGSRHEFLWEKSVPYDKSSLDQALEFIEALGSNMGGTEIRGAIEASVKSRSQDMPLEVMILTDGQIWDQLELFSFVRESAADNKTRFFSLGIGNAASHSLIEGIARAGNGFSQSVIAYEDLSKKVVRMLKGAISPHIVDYQLDVDWEGDSEPDFEMVDSGSDMQTEETLKTPSSTPEKEQKPISLFDPAYQETDTETEPHEEPKLTTPDLLQTPAKIPSLYPHIRTTVCTLIDPRFADRTPKTLTFRATSDHGPLRLTIPIQHTGKGEMIHQLACRKAVIELEEGHGWLSNSKDEQGHAFSDFHPTIKEKIITRECQNLGIKYQVTGKHCSFVALEQKSDDPAAKILDPEVKLRAPGSGMGGSFRAGKVGSVASPPPPPLLQPRLKMMQMACDSASGYSPPPPPASAAAPMPVYSRCRLVASSPSQPVHEATGSTAPKKKKAAKSAAQYATPASPQPKPSTLDEITKLQTFEGYWEWTLELLKILCLDANKIKSTLASELAKNNRSQLVANESDTHNAMATILAMAYLEHKAGDQKPVWELMFQKAEEWLQLSLAQMKEDGIALEECRAGLAGLV